METGMFLCDVCLVYSNSRTTLIDHLKGKMHNSKWEFLKRNIDNWGEVNNKFCGICLVPFSSADNARQHYITQCHARKRKLFECLPQCSTNTLSEMTSNE